MGLDRHHREHDVYPRENARGDPGRKLSNGPAFTQVMEARSVAHLGLPGFPLPHIAACIRTPPPLAERITRAFGRLPSRCRVAWSGAVVIPEPRRTGKEVNSTGPFVPGACAPLERNRATLPGRFGLSSRRLPCLHLRSFRQKSLRGDRGWF